MSWWWFDCLSIPHGFECDPLIPVKKIESPQPSVFDCRKWTLTKPVTLNKNSYSSIARYWWTILAVEAET